MNIHRLILAISALALILPILAAPAFAADNWPNYGRDPQHTGRNAEATGYNANQLRPVWVFPRPADGDADAGVTEIVDDLDAGFTAHPPGAFGISTDGSLLQPADDAFYHVYHFARAVRATPTVLFTWTPSNPGTYYIEVWFPSSMDYPETALKNTRAAVYTVVDASGNTHNFTVDQRSGGEWVRLRAQAFELGARSRVGLTNRTTDAGGPGVPDVYVVADAVRFVPTTGIEIYASPVADTAYVDPNDPDRSVPVAYAATVETANAYGAISTDDFGAVYCIYSYTGGAQGSHEWNLIGRPAWRYPLHPSEHGRGELEKPPHNRAISPIEGPIEGGVYSTPTLYRDKIVFAGMDRQVYCVQASGENAGRLDWKGPGVTISEPTGADGWEEPITDRGDAFGHQFLRTTVGRGNPISWQAPMNLPEGMYSVYVWLPDKEGGEYRARRVKYTVYHEGTSSEMSVDQNLDSNAGTWVKLGESYWRPSRVELVTTNWGEVHNPDEDDENDIPGQRRIVADAVMIIPAELEAFSYSSPIIGGNKVFVGNTNGRVYALNIRDGSIAWVYPQTQRVRTPRRPEDAQAPPMGAIVSSPAYEEYGAEAYVYVTSMDGRLYKLDANTGELVWQYPSAEEEFGETFEYRSLDSSPMIFGDLVYVGGTNGRLYSINKRTGRPNWVRPKNAEDPDHSVVEVPLGAIRFSTPAMDAANRNVLVGSSDGYVYAFRAATGDGAWGNVSVSDYRDSGRNLYAPIQASVGLDGSGNAYAATMSGAVWWLDAYNGNFRDTSLDPNYRGRTGYAIDGEQAYASPAVANRYVYFGWSSGQLIAFSWYGFGGAFGDLSDDQLPGYDDSPGQIVERPIPAHRPEMNIFSYLGDGGTISARETIRAIREISNINREQDRYRLGKGEVLTTPGFFDAARSKFRSDPAVDANREAAHSYAWRHENTTQVFLEWGEHVYLIAWNLNQLDDIAGREPWDHEDADFYWTSSMISEKRQNVRFTFTNATPGPASGQIANTRNADYLVEYELDELKDGEPQYRSLAVCILHVGRSRRNPPSPGYGWQFKVNTTLRATTGRGRISLPSFVPELTGSHGSFKVHKDSRNEQRPQRIGVNNPLAIRDDADFFGMQVTSLAWPDYSFKSNRNDPAAHFNGNGGVNINPDTGVIEESNPWMEKWPTIDLGPTNHGTNSRVAHLGVMDRSALGTAGARIENFRVQAGELAWFGGAQAVGQSGGMILPWEFPPPYKKDYPDISAERIAMNKGMDGRDPTIQDTDLPPARPQGEPYHRALLAPEVVKTIVDIPRFQPANLSGYGTYMVAYLDGDGGTRGRFDDGNVRRGRPTTYIEPHRKFRIGVSVPPDLRILVEESTIDLGKAPHGMGMYLTPGFQASYATGDPFMGTLRSPVVEPWFKEFTVKNVGNTNLYNLKVTAPPLFHDRNWMNTIGPRNDPHGNPFVFSSLPTSKGNRDPVFSQAPYTIGGLGYNLGHTLAKARVGDPDPTELTIPDRRAIEEEYLAGWPLGSEMKPVISCQVPLGTPIGMYGGYVSVFADLTKTGRPNPGAEPISTPFLVTVQVRENQMTDGTTLGSLPNIDAVRSDGTLVKEIAGGDAQPAAWRDPVSGNMHVFWATDRYADFGIPGPWYLSGAKLRGDGVNWSFLPWDSGSYGYQWWEVRNDWQLPWFGWPVPEDPNDPGVRGALALGSVRHSAPTVALHPSQYSPVLADRNPNKAWLFWQGQADFRDDTTGRLNRDYRIFYTDATGGDVTSQDKPVFSLERDLHMPKIGPRPLITGFGGSDQLWMFYHGGDSGQWNIFATVNDDPNNNPERWSQEVRLLTPAALVSVSEPVGVGRNLGDYGSLDVIYTGVSKHLQNSDLLMTRYGRIGPHEPYDLKLEAQNQPRVVYDVSEYRDPSGIAIAANQRLRGEILQRDSRHNVYVAKHMGWMRHLGEEFDEEINLTDISSGLWLDAATDTPFVKVLIPGQPPLYATHNVRPQIDRATAVFKFSYPEGSPEEQILGEMLLDHSAGIVRFTKLLPPDSLVVAQYTPRAQRLTTGQDPDNLPYAFLQKTRMHGDYDLGLVGPDDTDPVDRLWVFWRKPSASGLRASTIFFKTYRLALDPPLTDLPPVKMQQSGARLRPASIEITGGIPCQVDPSGRMIYFTENHEIFAGMHDLPGFEITYQTERGGNVRIPVDGKVTPTTVQVDGETFETVTRRIIWKEELPETALLGYAADAMINESQVCAFVDPFERPTKVWVFWSSTKEGSTDLFYEAISPNFTLR